MIENLTIVTSCTNYGKYLPAWAKSIADMATRPARVCIFTHGTEDDRLAGEQAATVLGGVGITVRRTHSDVRLDFGTARNRAVEMSDTEWVMHLDCDDLIMPHAGEVIIQMMPTADVISFGYVRTGDLASGPKNKMRIYRSGDGLAMLGHSAPCSGVSPFRRSLWERSPYRTDMLGAWDTALWIGFARLGARFRATKQPCFWYRQHQDSVFNKRRTIVDWTHLRTVAQLKSLRMNSIPGSVAIVVPRDLKSTPQRDRIWDFVKRRYTKVHPSWPIFEGYCGTPDWCKGNAIDNALKASTAEILVIADADCMVPKSALEDAVTAVRNGAAWAIPHRLVYRLAKGPTDVVLNATDITALPSYESMPLDRKAYEGYAGGGIVVVRRFHYDAVGGIPLGFKGWGSEDEALALLLDTCIGPAVRGNADLIHLWHAPQASKSAPGRVQQNSRYLKQLKLAALDGRDALIKAISARLPSVMTHEHLLPLKERARLKGLTEEQYGVDLAARQSYLARRNGRVG